MTFKRSELKKWVDGDKDGNHRKPEKSVILADELISMFFKRNWFDAGQIDGIELLNKCRDRHLCVMGNIPNFWDLDSAIYPILTFWVHIHERGRAWVFQKDKNPFASDKWHKKDNEKLFRKRKNPYSCNGFLTEIIFPDWTPQEKEEYYSVRNTKRKDTEGQRTKADNYGQIKKQRDEMIKFTYDYGKRINKKYKNESEINQKTIADIVGLEHQTISFILRGENKK